MATTPAIKRDKRNIGKRVQVIHPESIYYGRTGTICGYRGDQTKGNVYCKVRIDGNHKQAIVDTMSAKNIRII